MSRHSLESYPLPTSQSFPPSRVAWQLEPQRAALLIHDMQDYFLDFYQPGGSLVPALVDAVCRLRAHCQRLGIPIIFSAQPEKQTEKERGLLGQLWGPGITGAPDLAGIHAALAPTAADLVLKKWRYSAFQKTTLLQELQQRGRNQLIICGIFGHIGCMLTAAEAFMQDIEIFMIGDAIGDFSRVDHDFTLNYVASRCGQIACVADIASL